MKNFKLSKADFSIPFPIIHERNKKLISQFQKIRKENAGSKGFICLSNSFTKLDNSNSHSQETNSIGQSAALNGQDQIKNFCSSNSKKRSLSSKGNSNPNKSLLPTNDAQIRVTPKFKMTKKKHPPFIPKIDLGKEIREKKKETISQSDNVSISNTEIPKTGSSLIILNLNPSPKKEKSEYPDVNINIPPFKKSEISEQSKMEFTFNFKASIMHPTPNPEFKEHCETEAGIKKEENVAQCKKHIPLLFANNHPIKAKLMNFKNMKKFNFKIINHNAERKIQTVNEQQEQEQVPQNEEIKIQVIHKNPLIQSANISDLKSHPEETKNIQNLKMKPPMIKSFQSTEKMKIFSKNPLKKSSSSIIILPTDIETSEFEASNRNSQIKTCHSNSNGGSLSGTPKIIRNHPQIKHFFE